MVFELSGDCGTLCTGCNIVYKIIIILCFGYECYDIYLLIICLLFIEGIFYYFNLIIHILSFNITHNIEINDCNK